MVQHHPLVQALARLGAMALLVVYLFQGLGTALGMGRSIGAFFGDSLGGTFIAGRAFDTLVMGIGAFLGGLCGLMVYMVLGALLGTAAGAIAVRYLIEPGRDRR